VSLLAQEEVDPKKSEKPEKPKLLEVGGAVPESLLLTDVDGRQISMKDLRGKVVFLAWYSVNCPAIRAAGPKINLLAKKYVKEKNVAVFTINSDFRELADSKPEGTDKDGKPIKPYLKIRSHWTKKEMIPPALVDPGNVIADFFQAKTTPHIFVVDAKGVLQYSGAFDNDSRGRKKPKDLLPYADLAIQALLKGEKVSNPFTKPYG
jgi:thiol-disulfide isomerase/thioredoxin